jgi:endonuclease/exonuclease/phosphatase family metal-dependent hydrolase
MMADSARPAFKIKIPDERIFHKMQKVRRLAVLGLTIVLGIGLWHASRNVCPGPAAGTSVEGSVTTLSSPASSRGNGVKFARFQQEERGKAGRAHDGVKLIPATEGGGSSGLRPVSHADDAHPRPTIRMGTFNIHGGTGTDGRRDLDRVAACLGGLDFVALNEIHGWSALSGSDQAEWLGRRLGMQWLFASANEKWYYQEFGNGFLTRLPVAYWERIPLPRKFDRGYRNMVLVALDVRPPKHDPVPIRLVITHVNRRYDAEREAQLRVVIAQFLALPEPAVLLGDLNSEASDPQMRRLLATPGVHDAGGEKLVAKAAGRIDWIIARGLRPVDAGIFDNGASDHPFVWVELELPQ